MIKRLDLEKIFLSVLSEDADSDKINKRILNLNNDDWDYLLKFSQNNGIFPVFCSQLLNLKLKHIPEEIITKFKEIYLYNLKKNSLLESELLRVVSALQDYKIPVIPLKGTVLARYLYRDLALRQTSDDLDLLIPSIGAGVLEDIFQGLGYILKDEAKISRLYYEFHGQLAFIRSKPKENIFRVDLHSNFHDRFNKIQVNKIWLNAKEIKIDSLKFLFPSDEDLLLYLCLTIVSGGHFIGLKYLYDLRMLINRAGKTMDWNIVKEKAGEFNLQVAVNLSLRLYKEFFHTEIQEEIINNFKIGFLQDNLLRFWVNKKNILYSRDKLASSYVWRFLVIPYIYSANLFEFSRIILRYSKYLFLKLKILIEV